MGSEAFTVARYLTNGCIDTSFGNGYGQILQNVATGADKGQAQVIESDILEKERKREFELSRSDRFRYRRGPEQENARWAIVSGAQKMDRKSAQT